MLFSAVHSVIRAMPEIPDTAAQKLIFWMLGALFVAMTAIGSATASHLITQVDSMSEQMSSLQVTLATQTVREENAEKRLARIEQKLDESTH